MHNSLILGLMSGTSFDGIDASFLYTDGINFKRTPFNLTQKYNTLTIKHLREALDNPNYFITCKKKMQRLINLVTIDHYNVAKNLIDMSGLSPDYIGFHGQTILHKPDKRISVQIGNGQMLAKLLQKEVIYNFRFNDLVNGGQGAPISPIYHLALMNNLKNQFPMCFLNIGGIANITFADKISLIGYDVGPGNNLVDAFIQKNTKLLFDNNGEITKKGIPNQNIVDKNLNHPFFLKNYPKSLDRKTFLHIINDKKLNKLSLEDALSTLSQLTIIPIVDEIKKLSKQPKILVIMGGGQHNSYFVEELKSKLAFSIKTADEIGLPGDMIEAELIAYLAARKINNLPSSFNSTTGVNTATILGEHIKN